MFFIEAFVGDRHLLTLPCPHRLTRYHEVIEQITKTCPEPELSGAPAQEVASVYRRLMHAAEVYSESGCIEANDMADLSRIVQFVTFGSIARDFMKMARQHHVQVMMPSSMDEAPEIAWVLTTPQDRQHLLARVDVHTRRLYQEQFQEIGHVANAPDQVM